MTGVGGSSWWAALLIGFINWYFLLARGPPPRPRCRAGSRPCLLVDVAINRPTSA